MKKEQIKIVVPAKNYLKNNTYKKINSEAYKYCYCPDCRCQQCEN